MELLWHTSGFLVSTIFWHSPCFVESPQQNRSSLDLPFYRYTVWYKRNLLVQVRRQQLGRSFPHPFRHPLARISGSWAHVPRGIYHDNTPLLRRSCRNQNHQLRQSCAVFYALCTRASSFRFDSLNPIHGVSRVSLLFDECQWVWWFSWPRELFQVQPPRTVRWHCITFLLRESRHPWVRHSEYMYFFLPKPILLRTMLREALFVYGIQRVEVVKDLFLLCFVWDIDSSSIVWRLSAQHSGLYDSYVLRCSGYVYDAERCYLGYPRSSLDPVRRLCLQRTRRIVLCLYIIGTILGRHLSASSSATPINWFDATKTYWISLRLFEYQCLLSHGRFEAIERRYCKEEKSIGRQRNWPSKCRPIWGMKNKIILRTHWLGCISLIYTWLRERSTSRKRR